jgi:hypothetical protein
VVACCEANVGVVLNFVEKQVVAHAYVPGDDDAVKELVKDLAARLNFPKKKFGFRLGTTIVYEDIGLLHWLSRVVWDQGRNLGQAVELVHLQVAVEMLNQAMVPQGQSLLDVIAREQPHLGIKVEAGKELNESSLAQSGFFVIRGFLVRSLKRRPFRNCLNACCGARNGRIIF